MEHLRDDIDTRISYLCSSCDNCNSVSRHNHSGHVKKTINSFISMSSIKQSHEQLAEKYEELAEERDDLQDNQEKLLDQIASLKNIIIDYEKETILNIDREGSLFTRIDKLKHLLEIANEENVMLKKEIEKLKY